MREKYRETFRKCGIFRGLTDSEILEALVILEAHHREFKKGDIIVRFNEPMSYAVVLLEGSITCTLFEPIDFPLIIKHASPGDTAALPLACLPNSLSRVEVTAIKNSVVLFLSLNNLIYNDEIDYSFSSRIKTNLITELSHHSSRLNERLRIIAHNSIKDRIKLYLDTLSKDHNGYIHIPLSMTDFAHYLHVDKSALYRTIRELKSEGILEWEKNKVKIIKEHLF